MPAGSFSSWSDVQSVGSASGSASSVGGAFGRNRTPLWRALNLEPGPGSNRGRVSRVLEPTAPAAEEGLTENNLSTSDARRVIAEQQLLLQRQQAHMVWMQRQLKKAAVAGATPTPEPSPAPEQSPTPEKSQSAEPSPEPEQSPTPEKSPTPEPSPAPAPAPRVQRL